MHPGGYTPILWGRPDAQLSPTESVRGSLEDITSLKPKDNGKFVLEKAPNNDRRLKQDSALNFPAPKIQEHKPKN